MTVGGCLMAVLLNPPMSTSGSKSRHAVARAAAVLGYDRVEIVNLCVSPSCSVVDLNHVRGQDGWTLARVEMRQVLFGATGVLGAWGVSGLTGSARRARDEQVIWLLHEVDQAGITSVWMAGAQPRHPSRWHQYLSDKYGRTAGGSFNERLKQILAPVPVASYLAVQQSSP